MTETHGVPALGFEAIWEKTVVSNAGGTAALMIRITPHEAPQASRRAPLDVAFVLDRSGSMSGPKLELVKQAATTAISLLRDEDRAALVVFDDHVSLLHPIEHTTPRVKGAMKVSLHGVDSGGSTNLSGGWLTGCNELAQSAGTGNAARIRRALLLTDGQANAGIVDHAELGHHASELRRRGVGTTTMGVGEDFDEELLSGMAEAGGGNFQYIASPAELPAFFERELGDLLSVVASNLTLSITMPHGMRGTLLNAFPHERHGKRIDVFLGDISSSDEIVLVFEMQLAPSAVGMLHRVTATASWVDPAADAKSGAEFEPRPLATTWPQVVEAAPPNPAVAEEVAIQRAASIQREAMRLDRHGRTAESRTHLASAIGHLAAAPASPRVLDSMMAINELAEMSAHEELPSHMRKRATHDAMHRSRGKRDDQTR